MTAFFISLSALLLLIAGILLLTVSVSVRTGHETVVAVRIGGIRVYTNPPNKQKKKSEKASPSPPASQEAPKKKISFFKPLKDKLGFSGAVKELASLAFSVLGRLKRLKKHLRFRNVVLRIHVASEDAAKTAVEYGVVCTAVYPVVSLFQALFPSSVKQIDIRSDFQAENGNIQGSGTFSTRIFWLLLAAYGVFEEWRAFQKRNGLPRREGKDGKHE